MARRQALTYAASQWGSTDPKAASQWAQQLTDPKALEEATMGVMSGWLNSDKRAALAWAGQLPTTVRDKVLEVANPKVSP